jgi:hypothetical protein
MVQLVVRKLAAYFLGAFVCAELVFLPLSNILQRVPRRVPPPPDEMFAPLRREGRATDSDVAQAAIDATGTACDRWMEATAQGQPWSLFAPRFGRNGTFLTLQVKTASGPVEMRSRFEPADVNHYVRYDLTHYRQFYREVSYSIVYWMWQPDSFDRQGPEWRDAIREYVGTFKHSLPAYVRWRLDGELPRADVREVIVAVRVFLPPKPGDVRPEPATLPLARWVPERPGEVAPYDPVSRQFVANSFNP